MRDAEVERWGLYSVFISCLLVAANIGVALVSRSLAVQAETVHNVVDLIASFSVLFGLKLSKRKTPAFPYGLYKIENVIAVGVGFLTFLSAWEIGRSALLAGTSSRAVDMWMVITIAVTAVVPFIYSHFELSAGRRANSPALVAGAREYRLHVLTASAVLAALLAHNLNLPLDRLVHRPSSS